MVATIAKKSGKVPMTASNESIARRWFEEVWNQRRAETVRELLTPDSYGHTHSGSLQGQEEFLKPVHTPFLESFPDLRLIIEDTVAEGDRVVVRWRVEGTHRGAGLGVEPTQRRVSFRGMTWLRFGNGKILEGIDCWNHSGLLETLRSGQAAPSIELI
jgi:steroid delta-isomerase-like uncharacterized protein